MAIRRHGRVVTALAGTAGAVLVAAPLAAQQPDPGIAGPRMQMINAASLQCQAGNPQACALVPQLQQTGNDLAQAQFACQQGDP